MVWSFFASRCLSLHHSVPPLCDEVECALIYFSLIYPWITSSFPLLPLVTLLVHFVRGFRWQLVLVYALILLSVLNIRSASWFRIVSSIISVLSLLLCYLIPAVPLIKATKGFRVGVQDISLKSGSKDNFLVRCYYPCEESRPNSFVSTVVHALLELEVVLVVGAFIILRLLSDFEVNESNYINSLVAVSPIVFQILRKHLYQTRTSPYIPEGLVACNAMADFATLPRPIFTHLWTIKIGCIEDAQISRSSGNRIVLMAPGLGGLRGSYSGLCILLAAQGYFVVSLESADSTPAVTLLPSGLSRTYKPYIKSPGEAPSSKGEHEFRHSQLIHRTQEFSEIMHMLNNPSKCDGVMLSFTQDRRRSDNWLGWLAFKFSYSSDLDKSAFWRSLRSHRFASKPFLVGHSFGGANVLHLGTSNDVGATQFRENWGVGGIVALDPWCFPLSEHSLRPKHHSIAAPMLVMHAQLFQWEENMELERSIVSGADKVLHFRIRNAGHYDFNEIGFLSPPLTAQMKKTGSQDPVLLQKRINASILDFLKCVNEGLGPIEVAEAATEAAASGVEAGSDDKLENPLPAAVTAPGGSMALYRCFDRIQRIPGMEVLEARW